MRLPALASTLMCLFAGLCLACEDGSTALHASSAPAKSQLDQLLAPIALYPDQLLAQMLLCSSNPRKVSELDTWLGANTRLKGSDLQDAATVAGFEPSFVALTLFPQIVNMMAAKLDWTTRLGQAFAADRKAVFASIQRLRTQARDAGTLKSTPQQYVEIRTTSEGQQVIVIEPSNPQIVYVPQYDSEAVYAPPSTTRVVVEDDDDDEVVAAGLIGFAACVAIGAAIDNDYYYGPYGWRGGFYMYNDAWDDWYDHREDWMDHRATGSQAQRTERQRMRQQTRAASPARNTAVTAESRGYSRDAVRETSVRQGRSSDAFSSYSRGTSERAASSRGQRSRNSGARQRGSGGRRQGW